MKRLVWFTEHDEIPDNAEFILKETRREPDLDQDINELMKVGSTMRFVTNTYYLHYLPIEKDNGAKAKEALALGEGEMG